jgi:hypothetical protein
MIRRRQWQPPPKCQHCGDTIKRTEHRNNYDLKTAKYCSVSCFKTARGVATAKPGEDAFYRCAESGEVKSLTDWAREFANRNWRVTTLSGVKSGLVKSIREQRSYRGSTFVKVEAPHAEQGR